MYEDNDNSSYETSTRGNVLGFINKHKVPLFVAAGIIDIAIIIAIAVAVSNFI